MPALFHSLNRASALSRRDSYAALGNDFVDGVQGLPTLKAFGQSRAHGDLLADRARSLYRSTMLVLAANIVTSGITILGISAGAALALGWGAVRVQQGTLELQVLLIVLMLGVEAFRPLRELVALYHRGMIAMSASDGDLRGAGREARGGRSAPRRGADRGGTARWRPRSASRTSASSTPPAGPRHCATCRSRCEAGKTLGVVGPSGAGKSTLVWLMLRFFDSGPGRVLVGGRDVREIPLSTLRESVAVVTQDTYLFYGTVAENLRIARPDATQAEIEAAARAANAHDFIMALPQRVRHDRRRARRAAVRRAAPAAGHRAGAAEGRADPGAGRGALQRGRRERGGDPAGAGAAPAGPNDAGDRPPALQRGERRPDPGARRRQGRRDGRHAELLATGGVYASLMAAQRAESTVDVVLKTDGLDRRYGPAAL